MKLNVNSMRYMYFTHSIAKCWIHIFSHFDAFNAMQKKKFSLIKLICFNRPFSSIITAHPVFVFALWLWWMMITKQGKPEMNLMRNRQFTKMSAKEMKKCQQRIQPFRFGWSLIWIYFLNWLLCEIAKARFSHDVT